MHDLTTFKEPPNNLEAEQALLGAILVNNQCYHNVKEFLGPSHFYEPVHERIYNAIEIMINKGQIADPVKLMPQFKDDDALDDVGREKYLVKLSASAVTIINHEDYAKSILDLAIKRNIISLGRDLEILVHENDVDMGTVEIVGKVEDWLKDYYDENSTLSHKTLRSMGEVVDSALERIDRAKNEGTGIVGVRTGIKSLDEFLGGLRVGVYTLGGATAMGKSAIANQIAVGASRHGHGVLFVSKEMDAEDNMNRAISAQILKTTDKSIPHFIIGVGALNSEDHTRVIRAAGELRNLPIEWMDESNVTCNKLRARFKRTARIMKKRGQSLDLIIIDYIQQMRPNSKSNNRYNDISNVSDEVLDLSKELHIPILVLSQLSRGIATRDNKRPILQDLKETGSLEQDASAVIFVYRPEYYIEKEKPTDTSKMDDWNRRMDDVAGLTELIIPKHRFGKTGTIKLNSNMAANSFSEWGDDHD